MAYRTTRSGSVALVALVLYSAALLLAALPEPVRPGFLHDASRLTDNVLRQVLIRAGIPVFSPPRERITDVLRADCIYVRGVDGAGRRSWIEPPDGRCVTQGPKPSIPDVEWMLRSLMTGGEGFQTAAMVQAVVGDFFCHASPWQSRDLSEIEILWVQPRFQIETGVESVRPVLAFRWRCAPPGVISDSRPPSAAEVEAFLGEGA